MDLCPHQKANSDVERLRQGVLKRLPMDDFNKTLRRLSKHNNSLAKFFIKDPRLKNPGVFL